MTEPVVLVDVDVDALLMEILRAAIPEADALVVEFLPADWTARYPVVTATRIGGGDVDPELLIRALAQVNVFHNDRTAAFALAGRCKSALVAACTYQTPFSRGSVSGFRESAPPVAVRVDGQPDRETFIPATYELYISRP